MRQITEAIIAAAVAALVIIAGGCKPTSAKSNSDPAANLQADTAADLVVNTNEVAVIETKFGKMVAEFYYDDAPKTVMNFKKLARRGFYDGTAFHRIVKGFMIQGGDPISKDPKRTDLGSGGPGYSIKAEFNKQKHVLGVLSMARSSHPDSAGSQFFICLGAADFLDGQYTAFGKLVAGEDVLQQIGNLPTKMDSSGGEQSVPLERVAMEKVSIKTRDEVLKK